jgi:protease I
VGSNGDWHLLQLPASEASVMIEVSAFCRYWRIVAVSIKAAFPDTASKIYCKGASRTPLSAQAIVRHFHEAQKPIFTICHGVQIMIVVDGVVRVKKVEALGACEPE